MIIDAFAHGLHGGYLDKLASSGGNWTKQKIENERRRAADRPQMLDIPLRLSHLDKYGIDKQVVTPTNYWDIDRFPGDAEERLEITRALNDNMAKIMADAKGRLLAVGSMTLRDFSTEHRREMERAVKTLGLKGLNIQSNINGKPPDSPEFEEFWQTAAALDVPVYIHPQDPVAKTDRSYEAEYDLIHNFGWPYETTLVLSRLVFSGVIERHPNLKIISHHLGGGMIPFFWGRILETYAPEKQLQLLGRKMPKPLFEYFSRFYFDTAVGGSSAALQCAYDVFGAGRMVFATDYPFGPGGGLNRLETYPKIILALHLSETEYKAIFAGNIRRVIKI